jgi:hypothetical protein
MPLESFPQLTIHDELKQKFLSGQMGPAEFRNALLELDQSTPDRKQSLENLKLLEDEAVVSFIEQQSQEIQNGYYRFLSFTQFHVGQYVACEQRDQEKALGYFKATLDSFEKAGVDEDYTEEWGIYIKGTIAYFKNDLEALKECHSLISTGKNGPVLHVLIQGIEKRGTPSYIEDYDLK